MLKNKNGVKNKQIFICLFFLLFSNLHIFADEQNSSDYDLFFNNYLFLPDLSFHNSEVSEENVNFLLEKIENLKLYNHNYWHILLHYKKKGNGYKSIFHGDDFFLAEDGATNPKAELEADLKDFLKGKNIDKFPARYKWLKSQLETENEKYFDFRNEIYSDTFRPEEAYLLFPAGYLRNPASIYGHTLILFSKKNNSAANNKVFAFIAEDTKDSNIKKVFKGLFGAYDGLFKFSTYASQIGKYNEKESRDIWEYKLKLTPEQLDFLYSHAIELTNAHIKYLYTNQNCTAELMEALRAAYPEENFLGMMGGICEPVEAVKLLYKKGFTEEPDYRPSIASRLDYEESFLTNKQKKAAADYNFGRISLEEFDQYFSNDFEKLVGYNLAVNAMKIRVYNQDLEREKYVQRAMPIAVASESLNADFKDDIVNKDFPHLGHDLCRLTVSAGYDNGDLFTQYYFRLASQNFMDIDKGMLKNTQLSFFSGSCSYYPLLNNFQLDTLDIVNIKSISPTNRYFLGNAFEVIVGLERNLTETGDDLAFRTTNNVGLSYMLGKYNQFYSLVGYDIFINFDYRYWIDFLPGISVGFVTSAGPWKQHILAEYKLGLISGVHSRINLSLEESIGLFRNFYISAGTYFTRDYKRNILKGTIGFNFSF